MNAVSVLIEGNSCVARRQKADTLGTEANSTFLMSRHPAICSASIRPNTTLGKGKRETDWGKGRREGEGREGKGREGKGREEKRRGEEYATNAYKICLKLTHLSFHTI